MKPGFTYTVSILNIRNPPYFDASTYKWIIEITDSDEVKISYRSHESSSNYEMPIYQNDPLKN